MALRAALLLLGLGLVSPTNAAADEADGAAARDRLEARGCLACHTTDGTEGPGPTFAGLFDRETTVLSAGERRTIAMDTEYVTRAITDPGADVVEGFAAMPDLGVSEEDATELVVALRELPAETPPYQSMIPLAFGTLGFLLLHLLLSFHPVRRRLISKLGSKWFQIAYSIAVLVPFICIFVGWMVKPFVPLWELGAWARWVPMILMPLSFYFLIAGYTTKNPATAGQEKAARSGPSGVTTMTRHPALWGFALWGLSHLPSNGDLGALLLFGSITALALLGMKHIDARRARDLGEPWTAFVAQTSILPFAAVFSGRTKLDLSGQWWRLLAGGAAYGVMLALHEWELGVSPFPY